MGWLGAGTDNVGLGRLRACNLKGAFRYSSIFWTPVQASTWLRLVSAYHVI
jgi:hypothetical protein